MCLVWPCDDNILCVDGAEVLGTGRSVALRVRKTRTVRRSKDGTEVKYEVRKSASWYMDDIPDNYSIRAST
jgi:hypothetical protein